MNCEQYRSQLAQKGNSLGGEYKNKSERLVVKSVRQWVWRLSNLKLAEETVGWEWSVKWTILVWSKVVVKGDRHQVVSESSWKEIFFSHSDSKNVGAEKRGIKISPFLAVLYTQCSILSEIMKYPRDCQYCILISMTKKETNYLRTFSHRGQQFKLPASSPHSPSLSLWNPITGNQDIIRPALLGTPSSLVTPNSTNRPEGNNPETIWPQ